jgi:dihydroorotate dehydrogenase
MGNLLYDPLKTYEENYERNPLEWAAEAVQNSEGAPKEFTLPNGFVMPFGIAAGPLLNANYCAAAFKAGYDVCAYKTVRSGEHPSNPFPNILYVHPRTAELHFEEAVAGVLADSNAEAVINISNSFGVPSQNPDIWQEDMAKALSSKGPGQELVGSFQGLGGTVQSYVDAARLIVETGVKVLELNTSCPNEGTDSLLCFDPRLVGEITEAVKNEVGDIPLHIKIAYLNHRGTDEIDDVLFNELLEETVEKGRVQGIVAINTIPSRLLNAESQPALPGKGREVSGVCGPSIKWAGLKMVRHLQEARVRLEEKGAPNFKIVGVGGVCGPDDYREYIKAGADEVHAATGPIFNAGLAFEIKKDAIERSGE